MFLAFKEVVTTFLNLTDQGVNAVGPLFSYCDDDETRLALLILAEQNVSNK